MTEEQNKNKEEEEYFDRYTFGDYLMSDKGHDTVNKIIGVVDSLKKSTLDKSIKARIWNFWGTIGLFIIIILSTTYLISIDKFSSTVAVFFGTLAGYFFGKK